MSTLMFRLPAAVAVSATLALGTALADWEKMDPDDGRIRLAYAGGLADGYSTWTHFNLGNKYICEAGWWDWDTGPHQISAVFCWSDDGSNGWHKNHVDPGDFINWFKSTRDIEKRDLSRGSDAESAVGTIRLVAYDRNRDLSGESVRECVGFMLPWNRLSGRKRDIFAKFLAVTVCGKDDLTTSEAQLVAIVQGLSVSGEFNALIE